ncbi:hypothetical protein JZ751_008872 [Albula glossodonta]|uniref:Uncharacterized protein n=1 Tax=Albula glossodonta TaxID=121402 RepID=A0A8T2P855_9TELE|nr:hypothetical protein JZ751_008872 [Albula glossodonta]
MADQLENPAARRCGHEIRTEREARSLHGVFRPIRNSIHPSAEGQQSKGMEKGKNTSSCARACSVLFTQMEGGQFLCSPPSKHRHSPGTSACQWPRRSVVYIAFLRRHWYDRINQFPVKHLILHPATGTDTGHEGRLNLVDAITALCGIVAKSESRVSNKGLLRL